MRASIADGVKTLIRVAASSIASGRSSTWPQISAIASSSCASGWKSGRTERARSKNMLNGGFARERLEWELLLAADAQPRPTRHDDLQIGARSDNGRDGRRCIDDLLEVVEDEQKAAALDMRDEALLEVTLAIEQPERAGDRADDVSGSLTDWSGTTTTPSV